MPGVSMTKGIHVPDPSHCSKSTVPKLYKLGTEPFIVLI